MERIKSESLTEGHRSGTTGISGVKIRSGWRSSYCSSRSTVIISKIIRDICVNRSFPYRI